MKGFKDSTRTKYMCGGPVKKARGGMMDEGISTRPVDKYGRRMTDEELGMTPGGVDPAKKKPVVKGGAMAGAAAGALAGAAARAAGTRGLGAMSAREAQALKAAAKKAVPAHSDRPMIRRSKGGLTAMPKGKC